MKNLKQIFSAYYRLPELKDIDCFCVNLEGTYNEFNASLSLYFYSNGVIYLLNDESKNCTNIYDLSSYYNSLHGPGQSFLKGVNMEYQYLSKSLVIALTNGDVFSLELDTNELQCIGSVDSGLTAMEWSPDFEIVVFATGSNSIILMSAMFDPITEINLFDTGPAVKLMVNVGWGKKETQFHGSEGKEARTAPPVEGSKNVKDDMQTRISWRGDSTLFAVSVYSDTSEKREVKIFNQEGVFQCNGESLPGLEQSISWRPSGNLIALSQKLPNKHIVSFMEKNGLIHGNFALPANIEVKELYWNLDSSILCVICENKLLLYTVGNYYWYLKQQLDFSSSPVTMVRWDHNSPNLLHVIQFDGTYSVYQWIWNIYRTPSVSNNDGALVAVIDGNRILLSSFKKKIIPPPMSDHTVILSEPVNEIAFIQGQPLQQNNVLDCQQYIEHDVNNLIAYLCNKKIVLITNTIEDPKVSDEFEISNLEVDCLHHFSWLSPSILLCCGIKPGGDYYICEMNVSTNGIIAKSYTQLKQPLLSLVPFSTGLDNVAVFQLGDGQLFKYTLGGNVSKMSDHFAEPCSEFSVHDGNIIGLSELKRLYYNGNMLTSKATSYFVIPLFILITTSENTLLIYKYGGLKVTGLNYYYVGTGSVKSVYKQIGLEYSKIFLVSKSRDNHFTLSINQTFCHFISSVACLFSLYLNLTIIL